MADKIAITILTSARPAYLEKTLKSFFELNDLGSFPTLVLVNDRDEGTEKTINRYRDRFYSVLHSDTYLSCLEGYSFLMKEALKLDKPYIIHLEDDYVSRESLSVYLPELIGLMEETDNIGYIRLRSVKDRVKDHNMVTRRKIEYRKVGNIGVGNAHFTTNPTIIRSSTVRKIIPVAEENDAMHKYQELGLETGQLFADCFSHIGEKKALKILKWRKI